MAGLANASIMARYGETEVLCTVTASAKPREGVDFFPLSVDYEEKMYAVGKFRVHSFAEKAEQEKRQFLHPVVSTVLFVRFSQKI